MRKEYEQHIKKILKILKKAKLQVNIKKCDFYIISCITELISFLFENSIPAL